MQNKLLKPNDQDHHNGHEKFASGRLSPKQKQTLHKVKLILQQGRATEAISIFNEL